MLHKYLINYISIVQFSSHHQHYPQSIVSIVVILHSGAAVAVLVTV